MRDFRRFVREAHDRGLRVITELVINHTSDQHPVVPESAAGEARFGGARFLCLVATPTGNTTDTRIIFLDTEAVELDLGPDRKGLLLAPLL